MHGTNQQNNTFPAIRQLITEQNERRALLRQQSFDERGAYTYRQVEKAIASRLTVSRPLELPDILFVAQFLMWCTGEIITLEELCEMLFDEADFFTTNGFYTNEEINALYRAYQARFN